MTRNASYIRNINSRFEGDEVILYFQGNNPVRKVSTRDNFLMAIPL